jgi:HTH-type transcriptional regulator/antitoxin MqsA
MKSQPCVRCENRKDLDRFENETFTVAHSGMSTKVGGLSGWRCRACGEIEFDPESASKYSQAGDDLVRRAHRFIILRLKLMASAAITTDRESAIQYLEDLGQLDKPSLRKASE